MRDRAQTVIVGAGIVGASAAYHLAELGSTDVLVIDQGPLFETGGSTSHAPGLVFQTNGSRTMCRIAQDTVRLYGSLAVDGEPGWFGVGGIEIATTPERMAELRRRQGFARSYGIEDTALLTPAETAEKVPLVDAAAILGAYLVPSDGIAKAVRIVTALAAKASERGVSFEGGVTVTGFDIRDGRVHGVETDRGHIDCERVLICAGIWGPTVGALAGVPVPLVAVQHQLVWTDPIPELAGETREVVHPILRHQDHAMYFRHREDHYGVGNYRHEPIVTPQRDIRRHGDGPMPSLMPFTPADFASAEREAERVLPALAGHMRPADPARSINGMFSFTPDAGSIVGESANVRGLWLCEAVWVTHGGGMGQQVAEWMVNGEPGYDLAEADANRFYPFQTTPPYVQVRGAQQYREVYDILHPLQQMAAPRKLRLTPFFDRHAALGAECFTGAGWERPQWFEANRALLTGADWERRDAWAAMNWSPAVGAEHLATRERVALFDITPFAKLDVTGPDALALPGADLREPDRPAGRLGRLHGDAHAVAAGSGCDLTVTRKGDELFRVVTGGGSGQHDLAWMRATDPRRRARDDHRADRLAVRARAVGPEGARRAAGRHRRRRVERRVPVPDRAVPQRRRGRTGLGATHLVRRRAGLGAVRAVRDGRSRVGPAVGGGARARHRRGRVRGVRLAPAGEGLPALGPGHQHRARSVRGGARVRRAHGQGRVPGTGGARGDPATAGTRARSRA